MKRALYPGSFDPITLGHVDIIKRVSKQVDELVVVVAENSGKQSLFTAQERAGLVEASIGAQKNISVVVHSGLIVDLAKKMDTSLIIRGLRAVSDFEHEMAMANMNKSLYPKLETLIIFASPEFGHVASRMVKEVAKFNGSLEGLVAPAVEQALKKRIKDGTFR